MKAFKKGLKIAGIVLVTAGFLIGVLTLLITVWAVRLFGNISMSEILFHLKMPLDGTDPTTIIDAVMQVALPALLLTAGFLALLLVIIRLRRFARGQKEESAKDQQTPETEVQEQHCLAEKNCLAEAQTAVENTSTAKQKRKRNVIGRLLTRIPVWIFPILTVLVLISGVLFAEREVHITAFLQAQMQKTNFIEEEYIDPNAVTITFPEKKRNLIYIFLESMETSFASGKDGGAFEVDLIPELVGLANNHVNFSQTSGLGGASQLSGTSWTIAAMFAQTAGLPLKIPVDGNAMNQFSRFFPGVTSLGEILSKQGYQNHLMIGSDAVFGGRKNYFTQHGDYEIFDYYTAKETGKIPEDYYEFWGYEDQKLFEYAKEKLTEISQTDIPFNFTLLTVDTHFPNGYTCPLCQKEHDTAYKNALSCSSRQVADFVAWLTQQDFYENTTIVLSGDHQTMATQSIGEMPKEYERYIYNAFINSAVVPEQEKGRTFSTMDMFPTTLAAIGAKIDGDRLGLGTNLFSEKQTLIEEKGISYVNAELQKQSDFYDNKLLYGNKSLSDAKDELGKKQET